MAVFPDLIWPAIRFGRPNCVMRVIDNLQALTTVRYLGVESVNLMDEYFLVDLEGNVFHLGDFQLSKPIGAVRRVFMRLLNPLVQAEIRKFTKGERMAPNALKERILKDLEDYRDYWSDFSNIEEIEHEIRNANTTHELISAVPGPLP